MKKVGLFFGTFNPIHIGHLIIANHLVEFSDLDEVWFVITPQSPFKTKQSLLEDHHRYQMVYEAVQDYDKLKPSKIEFDLPQLIGAAFKLLKYGRNGLSIIRKKQPVPVASKNDSSV